MSDSLPRLSRDSRGYYRARWYDVAGERRQKNFGSGRDDAKRAFKEWICTWQNDPRVRTPSLPPPTTLTEAWAAMKDQVQDYYRRRDGKATGHAYDLELAFRAVIELFGHEPASSFTVDKLRLVREEMVEQDLALSTINARVHQIRRIFRRFVVAGLAPASVWQELQALDALRAGQRDLRVPERIAPVHDLTVEATCAKLPATLVAMVRLQLLTGMRPGEVCALTPAAVDVSKSPWSYRPRHHKNAHRGSGREILIGPLGQQVLAPYLRREITKPCFRPAEAMRQRHDARVASYEPAEDGYDYRETPSYQERAAARGEPAVRDQFAVNAYALAIRRAAEAAGVLHWSPNQLRHSAATRIRARFGLEAAQVVLGHANADVTEIYAERDRQKAIEVALALG